MVGWGKTAELEAKAHAARFADSEADDAGPSARRGYTLIAGREIPDDRELYRSTIRHDKDPISRLRARISLFVDEVRIRFFRFLLESPQLSWLARLFLGYVAIATWLRTQIMRVRVFLIRPVQAVLLIDVLAALMLAFFISNFFTGNFVETLAELINSWLIKPQLDFILGKDNMIEKVPFYLKIAVDWLFETLSYVPIRMGLMDPQSVVTAKSVSAHVAKVGFLIPKISYILRLEMILLAFFLRVPLMARKTPWEDSLPRLMK